MKYLLDIVVVIIAIITLIVISGPVYIQQSPIPDVNDINDCEEIDLGDLKWQAQAQQSMSEQALNMAKDR